MVRIRVSTRRRGIITRAALRKIGVDLIIGNASARAICWVLAVANGYTGAAIVPTLARIVNVLMLALM
jgi:hypothetical protein